jgi:hypothetical protein
LKKKIHKLINLPGTDNTLIAISSHEKDYFLCWKLNTNLKIELIKQPDFEVFKQKENITQTFSIFEYSDEKYPVSYKLISNKSEKGFLIDELKNIDYFLKISGQLSKEECSDLILKIKQTESVITAFEIDIQKIKSKHL